MVGVASIAVGALFLARPALSPHALVLLTGISALVIGAAETFLAFRARYAASG
ncbi:DUF308 domain-containing protein [Dactylosporangium sp. NPDC048998]|uniref:DUF308 domain-containing protein n=1 Tax=Dactylosporangium sp. NPDC048998 TaxID=3363976 RepID=UPI00371241A2